MNLIKEYTSEKPLSKKHNNKNMVKVSFKYVLVKKNWPLYM